MARKTKAGETPHPKKVHIGRVIAVLREALDMSQSDLSRESGVKRSSICEYEAGITTPDASTLERLLRAMCFRWSAVDLGGWFLERLFSECASTEAPGPRPDASALDVLLAEARKASAGTAQVSEASVRIEELVAEVQRREEPATKEAPPAVQSEDREPSPADRVLAREIVARMRRLTRDQQREELGRAPAWCRWAVCEALCYESQRACGSKPVQALALSELARTAGDTAAGDEPWRSKLRSIAWAHIGNALRAGDDLKASDHAFTEAARHLEAATGTRTDLLEEGLVFALKASLRRAQRRFDESADLLRRAAAVASTDTFRVQVLTSQAKLFEERGDLEEAIAILQGASEISLPDDDARVTLCVRHNLADNLSKLDRFREADALLPDVRALSRKAGGELDRIRLKWTEGRVVAGLGNVEKGIQSLTKVRGEFASHDMGYDTALVSLELSEFHARQGRTQEVKSLARHMVPIFKSQEIHREALAALLVFREAAEKEHVTAEFAREILLYLRRARHDPGLRFERGTGASVSSEIAL